MDHTQLTLDPLYPEKGHTQLKYLKKGLPISISPNVNQVEPWIRNINIVFKTRTINVKKAARYYNKRFLVTCSFCKRRLDLGSSIYIYKGESSFCTELCRERGILDDISAQVAAAENPQPSITPKNGSIFFIGP